MRPGKGILVIDDDAVFAEMLMDLLTREGFESSSAGDATQALIQAEALRPRLVICDLMMPAWGSGVDVYHWMRSSAVLRETPIVFLTAVNPEKARALIPADPRVRLLFKPVSTDMLRAAIDQLLTENGS